MRLRPDVVSHTWSRQSGSRVAEVFGAFAVGTGVGVAAGADPVRGAMAPPPVDGSGFEPPLPVPGSGAGSPPAGTSSEATVRYIAPAVANDHARDAERGAAPSGSTSEKRPSPALIRARRGSVQRTSTFPARGSPPASAVPSTRPSATVALREATVNDSGGCGCVPCGWTVTRSPARAVTSAENAPSRTATPSRRPATAPLRRTVTSTVSTSRRPLPETAPGAASITGAAAGRGAPALTPFTRVTRPPAVSRNHRSPLGSTTGDR